MTNIISVEPNSRCFEVTKPIKVATYDIDYAGHVSNIAYFRWLEDLRLLLLEEHFPLPKLMADGYMPVLASSSVDYKKAIRLFDRPQGHMWIEKIGWASLEFRGEIKVDGVVTTLARHVGVFVHPETHKPVRLPQELVAAFESFHQNSLSSVASGKTSLL